MTIKSKNQIKLELLQLILLILSSNSSRPYVVTYPSSRLWIKLRKEIFGADPRPGRRLTYKVREWIEVHEEL